MSNRWCIDFDGVIADLSTAFIEGCNERFGTNYTVDEEDDWNWWRRQPAKFSNYVWRELYPDESWFLAQVKPYDGAIEALVDLLTDVSGIVDQQPYVPRLGPPVQIITARKDPLVPLASLWLEKHLPVGMSITVVGTGSSGYQKAHHCDYRKLNVVVEDGVHNLRPMNYKTQRLFLVDRPWNAQEILPPRVQRVPGLQQAINAVAYSVTTPLEGAD